MNPQSFLVIQPVPHHIYKDPIFMWEILEHIWISKLADDRGQRVSGPLLMREMKLGEIEGSGLADYLWSSEDTAAVIRITGPAIPPDAFIPMMVPLWES